MLANVKLNVSIVLIALALVFWILSMSPKSPAILRPVALLLVILERLFVLLDLLPAS